MLNQLWSSTSAYFLRPITFVSSYQRRHFQPDLVAGLTVGIVALPQAIAYAMIAELPPQYGLYAAVVAAVFGALWGSSDHLSTGPTNTTSLLVLATLIPIADSGDERYLLAAGVMAVMVGIFKIVLGVARMGVLVNFVSDSVIIGFTAGAGVLIGANQLRHLLRLEIPSSASLVDTLQDLALHISEVHWVSLLIGGGVLVIVAVTKRLVPKFPGSLLGMVVATAIVGGLRLDQVGVSVIGQLPRGLPPLAHLPIFDLDLISQLSMGALAVGAISLVEAVAISRSIARQSGQQLDSNQEFIGQGIANLVAGFFSGMPVSGSFARSAINYEAGAKTSMSSIMAGLFVLITMVLIAPLASFLPRAALAGVLMVSAYGLIDRKEMARIWRGARGDAAIMVITSLATLFLPLQFAVLTGILISFAVYILGTSVPRIIPVLPSDNFSHFEPNPKAQPCTQLAILEIFGDLYFGASGHVEEEIRRYLDTHPSQRYLLLRMLSVDQIDISGVHALESIVRAIRQRGGDMYMVRTQTPVLELFKSTGFLDVLGEDHFLDYGTAISLLFNRILDPAICIYECEARVFKECLNLPRPGKLPEEKWMPLAAPKHPVPLISSLALWQELHQPKPPVVVDVREPREFHQGHIPQAESIPLFNLIKDPSQIPQIRPVVLVCRSGRRSARAFGLLNQKGYSNLRILEGGMLAWEYQGLLDAVDV